MIAAIGLLGGVAVSVSATPVKTQLLAMTRCSKDECVQEKETNCPPKKNCSEGKCREKKPEPCQRKSAARKVMEGN